jgi:enterochelin esterase-like enzyme
MNTSILSRVLVGAICLAAVAGWTGVQVEISAAGPVAVHAPLAPASEIFASVETEVEAVAGTGTDQAELGGDVGDGAPAGPEEPAAVGQDRLTPGDRLTSPVPAPALTPVGDVVPAQTQGQTQGQTQAQTRRQTRRQTQGQTNDSAVAAARSPAPLPSTALRHADDGASSAAGLAGGPPNVPVAIVPPVRPVAPFAGGFIPLSQTLNRELLDLSLDGAEPEATGEWREVRFFSRALGREQTYFAYLPPGYGVPSDGEPGVALRTYPTLYLLHGLGNPETAGKDEWRDYGVGESLDRLLALHLVEPMIVILPDGERGYWINQAGNGQQWADYVARDVVANVDATFNTEPARERRAIGGMSMGAHGALQLGLNYPQVFGIVGSHAPTLRSYEQAPSYFGPLAWFSHYDPLTLAQTSTAARHLYTWLDVGNADYWRMGVERLRQALEAQGAPLEYRVLEGEHQSWYWVNYLPEFLRFYSRALSAVGTTPEGAPLVVAAGPQRGSVGPA